MEYTISQFSPACGQNNSAFFVKYVHKQASDLHSHDFVEICYFPYGGGRHYINGDTHEIKAGEVCLLNYNTKHQLIPISPKNPIVVYNCLFKPSFIDYRLVNSRDFNDLTNNYLLKAFFTEESLTYHVINTTMDQSEEFMSMMKTLRRESADHQKGYLEMMRIIILEMLIKFFRIADDQSAHHSLCFTENPRLKPVFAYIAENYTRACPVQEMARLTGVCVPYFSQLFKASTGMTSSEFIQKLRIEHACDLLARDSHARILDVAVESGYNDIKFFNQVFKRHTGMTPREYQKHQEEKC